MTQRIVIDFVPVAIYKGTNQQQQRRLRMFKVRHQHLQNLIHVAWGNDYLRT